MNGMIKVIISGGGTGGHIFPAISIANALKEIDNNIDILFIGAEGKMEMERVPAAGYPIKGLPVAGLKRSLSLSNLSLPAKVIKSLKMAGHILREFNPDVVVGVGGYASAPLLWSATKRGIPALIQEQNSYAGLTNKILGKRAQTICVAYDGMDRFFPGEKIILTGNPIRKELSSHNDTCRSDAYTHFGLDPAKPTILIIGGSLGSKTINESVKTWADRNGDPQEFQILWQSGGYYRDDVDNYVNKKQFRNIINTPFIERMDYAYAAADLIISRAGAGTISELCAIGKATIFVPSPNVSEDHQTHNAMALVGKEAALMVKDSEAREKMMDTAVELLSNRVEIKRLESNMVKLAMPDADKVIAEEVIKLAKRKRDE